MSKYVKELMMDQFRSDLDGDKSVLILDLKGLDAISEYQLRKDLRSKKIKMRVLRNSLAGRVFEEMGIGGLGQYLAGRVVTLALSPVARVVTLANSPVSGILGQLKTLAEPAEAEASPEGGDAAPEVEA